MAHNKNSHVIKVMFRSQLAHLRKQKIFSLFIIYKFIISVVPQKTIVKQIPSGGEWKDNSRQMLPLHGVD